MATVVLDGGSTIKPNKRGSKEDRTGGSTGSELFLTILFGFPVKSVVPTRLVMFRLSFSLEISVRTGIWKGFCYFYYTAAHKKKTAKTLGGR